MKINEIEKIINEAFDNKQNISEKSEKNILNAINETIELTDKGKVRVAEKKNGKWETNQWVKKAILLSFRINKMTMSKGPYTTWYDKVPGKSVLWNEEDWKRRVIGMYQMELLEKDLLLPKEQSLCLVCKFGCLR